MISPSKHTNLEMSVLNISSLIIKRLISRGTERYDDLLDYLIVKKGSDVEIEFLNSLGLLYLLGKLQFHPHTDTVELVK